MTGTGYGNGFNNMTDYLRHVQAPLGVNQGMIYRLFTRESHHSRRACSSLVYWRQPCCFVFDCDCPLG